MTREVCGYLSYDDVSKAIEEMLPGLNRYDKIYTTPLIEAVERRRGCSFHWQTHGLHGWKTDAHRVIGPMMRDYARAHDLEYDSDGAISKPITPVPPSKKITAYAEDAARAKAERGLTPSLPYLGTEVSPATWEERAALEGLHEDGLVTKSGKAFRLWPTARAAQRYGPRRAERDLSPYERTEDPVRALYQIHYQARVDRDGDSYFHAADIRRKFAPSQIKQLEDRGVLRPSGHSHPLQQKYYVNTEHPDAYAVAVDQLKQEGWRNKLALHTYQDSVSKSLNCLANYYDDRATPVADREACVAGVKRVVDDARAITAGPAHIPAYDFVAFPLWARLLGGGYDYPQIAAAQDAAQELNAVIGPTYGRGGGVRETIPSLTDNLAERIQAMIAEGGDPGELKRRLRGPHSVLEHEVARRNNLPASEDVILPPASIPATAAVAATVLDPDNPLRGVAGSELKRRAIANMAQREPTRLNELWRAFEALPQASADRPAALEILREVGGVRTEAGETILL